MNIKIEIGNIVKYECDAIVNAANEFLEPGGGVCGAIFSAAGFAPLYDECRKLKRCETGKAVITNGYKLSAKYIIHAVGPIYRNDNVSGPLLESTYKSIIEVAEANKLNSIAIPAISTGIYGFPLNKACEIALNTLKNINTLYVNEVILVCYDKKTYDAYMKVLEK